MTINIIGSSVRVVVIIITLVITIIIGVASVVIVCATDAAVDVDAIVPLFYHNHY